MATIERPPWKYRTKAARADRNAQIMELWAMGWSRHTIAERFELTPVRVSQIVHSFGESFQEWEY